MTTWGADHDWNVRWVLVSGFWVQLASERFKCAYVAPNNDSGAFEAVVIPAPPVADLESLVATLDAVPGIALTVVRALGYIHLGAGAKGSNPRHARRRGAGHLHRRAARRRTRLLEHPAQRPDRAAPLPRFPVLLHPGSLGALDSARTSSYAGDNDTALRELLELHGDYRYRPASCSSWIPASLTMDPLGGRQRTPTALARRPRRRTAKSHHTRRASTPDRAVRYPDPPYDSIRRKPAGH